MSAISVEKMGTIDAGRQGENLARTIEFDVSSLLAKWPGAKIILLVKRKSDAEPYFAEATVEGHILKWPITEVETAVAGDGKIEIQAVLGEVIEKSVTATFRVSASLSGSASETLPEVHPSWVDEVLNAAGGGSSSNLFVVKMTQSGSSYVLDRTYEEIKAAMSQGNVCLLSDPMGYAYHGTRSEISESDNPCFQCFIQNDYDRARVDRVEVLPDGSVKWQSYDQLLVPNPWKLKLTGAVEAEYDGSKEVTVEIPSGGSGAGLPETADPLKQLVTDENGSVVWADRTDVTVNLPATELGTFVEEEGFGLARPWAADIEAGKTYTVNYNGVCYECLAIDMAAIDPAGAQSGICVLGNIAATGSDVEGGNPDAPFVLVTMSNALGQEGGVYAQLIPLDGATAVTLAVHSIGQASQSSHVFFLRITEQDGAYTTNQEWAPFWTAVQSGMVRVLMPTINASGTSYIRELTVYGTMPNGDAGEFAVVLYSPKQVLLGNEFLIAATHDGNGGITFLTMMD